MKMVVAKGDLQLDVGSKLLWGWGTWYSLHSQKFTAGAGEHKNPHRVEIELGTH
jgi:hypothetical protein